MNNNSWFKKENPFQTVIGLGGGATGFGAYSSSASKLYVDEVFDPGVYKGVSGSGVQITNNVNLSSKGGMVWVKSRDLSKSWYVFDNVSNTAQGASPNNSAYLNNTTVTPINNEAYQVTMNTDGATSPTTDDSDLGGNGNTYYMPMFRQAKGFFDIQTYTGTGSARDISHDLECVPGLILIKKTSAADDWYVWHTDIGTDKYLILNSTGQGGTSTSIWNDTAPTSSVFTVGGSAFSNQSGETYVAYIYAGGRSTAATARSVVFDGSSDYFEAGGGTDMELGTGDFTIETFVYFNSASNQAIYDGRPNGVQGAYISLYIDSGNLVFYTDSATRITSSAISAKQWYHVALVRNSSVTRLYLNGAEQGSYSDSSDYIVRTNGPVIGVARNLSNNPLDGKLSNYRIVKGTAVYTSSFRPPTEPLTDITNTKLLFCNDSSVTGSTVAPTGGTITDHGDLTASTDSPFYDPESFKYGEDEDKNIIKCGSYVGQSGSNTVNLGWEPQWVMIKNIDSDENWVIVDAIRPWANFSSGAGALFASSSTTESTYGPWGPTATGWKLDLNQREIDQNGQNYVYMAIRRPDGYVGKPASAGTDVFTMDTGNSSATIPCFDSNFPVDFAMRRAPALTDDWTTGARLLGEHRIFVDSSGAYSSNTGCVFDSNVGWATGQDSASQSWMWKRNKGMDVVFWTGEGTSMMSIKHNLNAVPEMIWTKNIDDGDNWICYHNGVNGGTNPQDYFIKTNEDSAQAADAGAWNDTAPTATHFTVGNADNVNYDGHRVLGFLFASIEGISKCGYYSGNGNATGPTVTTGFEPRLIIIKGTDTAEHWLVFDTLRGLSSSGVENRLLMNSTSAQDATYDYVNTTATGFTIHQTFDSINASGNNYIYYAHA